MVNGNNNTARFYGDGRNLLHVGDTKSIDNVPKLECRVVGEYDYGIELDVEKTWGSIYSFNKDARVDSKNHRNDIILLDNKFVTNECYTKSELFQWNLYIKKKPIDQKVYFKIDNSFIEWFRQDALTAYADEFIREHGSKITITDTHIFDIEGKILAHRPENIVGGYCLYLPKQNHVLGNTNYMSGKAGQVECPYFLDSIGNKVKATMTKTRNELVIDVPKQFWDWDYSKEALILDPTFGYTTKGGTTHSLRANRTGGTRFTCSDTMDINSANAWVKNMASADGHCKIFLTDTSRTIIANGVSNATDDYEIPYQSDANLDVTFGTAPSVTASTDYYLFAIPDAGNGTFPFYVYYDDGTPNYGHYDSVNSYSTPENPNGVTTSYKYSIYATGTAAGGSAQLSHVDGIALANISHYEGIAKANITKIEGFTI